MAYEKSADISEITRSMLKFPWLQNGYKTRGEAGIDRNRVRGRDLKKQDYLGPSSRQGTEFSKSMRKIRAGPWTY